jgi:hypothetical protein
LKIVSTFPLPRYLQWNVAEADWVLSSKGAETHLTFVESSYSTEIDLMQTPKMFQIHMCNYVLAKNTIKTYDCIIPLLDFPTKLLFVVVNLGWQSARTCLGLLLCFATGVSCDATCTGLSETCASERMQLITSEEQMNFVAWLNIFFHVAGGNTRKHVFGGKSKYLQEFRT